MAVYLDYAATTPVDKKIIKGMLEHSNIYGNPSSIHRIGKEAKAFLEENRQKIAEAIGAKPEEIIFTSGATESNNLAIRGTLSHFNREVNVITTEVEHMSILETVKGLKTHVNYVPIQENGLIDLNELNKEIDENTTLVSLHYVNNETGAIQPVKEIKERLPEGVLLHVDAAQAVGHVDVNVDDLGVDLMSMSGHKLYAPKGVGVLYIRSGTHLHAQLVGGKQERERRAGTENLLYSYAMSEAVKEAVQLKDERNSVILSRKEILIDGLNEAGVEFKVNGDLNSQSPHILNIYVPFSETELLLTALDIEGIYISGGSACNAGTVTPSHVITKMYDENRAAHSLRISFSHLTTEDDIDKTIEALKKLYERLK